MDGKRSGKRNGVHGRAQLLEPESLRKEFADMALELAERYKD
jgi:hypothetical protein